MLSKTKIICYLHFGTLKLEILWNIIEYFREFNTSLACKLLSKNNFDPKKSREAQLNILKATFSLLECLN